jgi:organic hydroperoxide reductase OsmC/OhrA
VSGTVHRYGTRCAWSGSTAAGYEHYERTHTGAAPTQPTLDLSSDPAFRGDADRWNPEALVVLAASSCQLLSFLAVAARARVDVVDYQDDAVGEMPEAASPMRVTRIVLRPRITVRGDVAEPRLAHLVEVAHRECFIANSLTSDIVVEPTFVTAS